MTLLFLGNLPAERIDNLHQAAACVAGSGFTLRFDRWACWRHNQIAWAGCTEPPLSLLTLVGQLTERLAEEGLPLELRDFVTHVTLLRKARCVPLPEFKAFDWPVNDFVLVESKLSQQGSQYSVIGRWALSTPDE